MNIKEYVKKGKLSFNNLLNLENVLEDDIYEIVSTAIELKNMRLVHESSSALKGKYVLLITKPSLPRLDITFQIAIKELSGVPVKTLMSGEQLENIISDTNYIKALSACGVSAVAVCTSKCSDSETFKNNLSVPIINSSELYSPCEALSIIMTMLENSHSLTNAKITLVGNLNIEDNSLLVGLTKLGADITILPCKNGVPNNNLLRYLSQYTDVKIEENKQIALKDADFVCFLKGDDKLYIDKEDFALNKKDYKILSVVPSDYNLFNKELCESNNSLVQKQSENFLHIAKSCLLLLAGKK